MENDILQSQFQRVDGWWKSTLQQNINPSGAVSLKVSKRTTVCPVIGKGLMEPSKRLFAKEKQIKGGNAWSISSSLLIMDLRDDFFYIFLKRFCNYNDAVFHFKMEGGYKLCKEQKPLSSVYKKKK